MFSDERLGVFCCGHVFRRERPVLFVAHADSDWQFVCGKSDHSDPAEPYHVSVGVLLEVDSTLHQVSDLPLDWEAERNDRSEHWIRHRMGTFDA
jgi:hypothetical protein